MSTIMGVIVSMLSSAAYEAIVKAIKISDENDTKKNWIVLVQGGSQILVTAVFVFGLAFLVSATYRIVANNRLKNIEREIRNYEIEYIDKNIYQWME